MELYSWFKLLSHKLSISPSRITMPMMMALKIAEYWIVDPIRNKITVLSLVEGFYEEAIYTGDALIKSEVVPEVQIKVSDILS